QRARGPIELDVLAIGGDLAEVLEEIGRRIEVAARGAGEPGAEPRVGSACGETRTQERLNVRSLDRTGDLVVVVARFQRQPARTGHVLRPAGVVHEAAREALGPFRAQVRVTAGEGGDLRVGL